MENPTKHCLDCGYPIEGLGTNTCPECGRAFDPDDCMSYAVDVGDLVRLYSSGNPVDVYLLREELIAEGIPAVVIGESLGAARGDLPMTGDTLPGVWVGKRQIERAMEIATRYDQQRRERLAAEQDLPPWTCEECGEEVEGAFEVCWNCQRERLGA